MKISVVVHPNAKRQHVEKDLFGTLHIYVHEPPLEGKANAAVRKALAAYLHLKQSYVILSKGEKSKIKVFEIVE